MSWKTDFFSILIGIWTRGLVRIRIRIIPDPDTDTQHCIKHHTIGYARYLSIQCSRDKSGSLRGAADPVKWCTYPGYIITVPNLQQHNAFFNYKEAAKPRQSEDKLGRNLRAASAAGLLPASTGESGARLSDATSLLAGPHDVRQDRWLGFWPIMVSCKHHLFPRWPPERNRPRCRSEDLGQLVPQCWHWIFVHFEKYPHPGRPMRFRGVGDMKRIEGERIQ